MKFDEGLSNFKYLRMMELINNMEINIIKKSYAPFYVFPIGYQYDCEETRMITKMIVGDDSIGFVGFGENGKTSVLDFNEIEEMAIENNKLGIVFSGGMGELILELENDIYTSLLYEMINLGRKGLDYEEISKVMLIDNCMVD